MWEKFNISTYKIPSYYNTGFTIDRKNNWITNTEKNYKIKVPFNIDKSNEIYYFELLTANNHLILKLIININLINNLLNSNTIIPYKNNLFKILKNAYNNDQFIINFNKFSGINDIIIDKYNNLSKTVKISNLYFNLMSEQIYLKRDNFLADKRCNIYFLFGKYQNYLVDKYNICIIDDKYKLIENLRIDKSNYKLINKAFFKKNRIINIDRDFFFSKLYLKEYKKFHSNYKSTYAYNNYKKYILNQDLSYPVYNVELFDNYIIIIKDNDLKKDKINNYVNHPILHSPNNTFIISDSLSYDKIYCSEKILKKTSKIYSLDYKNIINNHLYLDNFKHNIYEKYRNKTNVNLNKYIIDDIKIDLELINTSIQKICPINKTVINYKTCAKLSCKCDNFYEYHNLWIYFKNSKVCPYCTANIKSMSIFINKNDFLKNLFGNNFQKIIKKNKKIIYLYKNTNFFNSFIVQYKNLYNLDNFYLYSLSDTPIEEINPETVLLIESNVTFYDILNSFNNKDVRNIINIFKFSLSI